MQNNGLAQRKKVRCVCALDTVTQLCVRSESGKNVAHTIRVNGIELRRKHQMGKTKSVNFFFRDRLIRQAQEGLLGPVRGRPRQRS